MVQPEIIFQNQQNDDLNEMYYKHKHFTFMLNTVILLALVTFVFFRNGFCIDECIANQFRHLIFLKFTCLYVFDKFKTPR